jgi:threonine dehydrogenase-like Zn-dependent dehydrogenase
MDMKLCIVSGPGQTSVIDVPKPQAGPRDVLLAVRACGICGSDAMYISIGGLPGLEGRTPLGHEPAGEVVEVGSEVEVIAVGDHVVVNPMAAPSGIIGSGGASGGFADYLLIENAVLGTSVAIVPKHIPFEVAALNEPMAVARHAVNRSGVEAGDKIVVFGAGPIGLGATIGFTSLGASVVVVDVIPSRLEKALRVGAIGVIDSANEDVAARLIELHGAAPARRGEAKSQTDIYLDAAGVGAVVDAALASAKHGATLAVVAVHKRPVTIDFGQILGSELDIVFSMGYPTEIFEVTQDIIENWEKYAVIISDRFPFSEVQDALAAAATPGRADKVMVTFG